jgi:hypothetical protein
MTKTLRTLALALVAAAVIPAVSASAQDAAFGKGTKILDLGIVADPTGFGGGLEVGLLELAPNFTLGVGGAARTRASRAVLDHVDRGRGQRALRDPERAASSTCSPVPRSASFVAASTDARPMSRTPTSASASTSVRATC